MFRKILIANRGEIACRVIRTARRMGIATVAVHSDADRDALHVRMADEHIAIGTASAAESYLRIDRIVQACCSTGADAVHPGYGFLSERPDFARALADAGIAFIGPDAAAMAAMGDKIASKRLAAAAGVSTVPGHDEAIADADAAVRIARAIGYPVMLKASAGGGGKGMRIAADDDAVRAGFAAAQAEARASFGDDRILIEKFIVRPRHIEIQVLADAHGTTLALGERECSIQRRHQKVIEEAPSPFLDAATRRRMSEQAVALARAVGYRSAGTVEFIVDAARNFYFLEMNTRLQVEHPVTELVTGLDLVELMIRVAAGERLTLTEADTAPRGWALEARVYAEDPLRGFAPAPGRLTHYQEPESDAHTRVDSGVFAGGEFPVFYDPMIAKLCTWAPTRAEAIAVMRVAIDSYVIRGIAHNLPFLSALLHRPRFVAGDLSTDFIDAEYPAGFGTDDLRPADPTLLAAVAAVLHHRAVLRRPVAPGGVSLVVVLDGTAHPLHVASADGATDIAIGDRSLRVASDWRPGEPLFRGRVDDRDVRVQVERTGLSWRLFHAGAVVTAQVFAPHVAALLPIMQARKATTQDRVLRAPLAGRLVSLAVAAGDALAEGADVAVIEAMKMQTTVRAPRAGVVSRLLAESGAVLAADQPLLEFA